MATRIFISAITLAVLATTFLQAGVIPGRSGETRQSATGKRNHRHP